MQVSVAEVVELRAAELVLDTSSTKTEPAIQVQLPDVWGVKRRRQAVSGRYTIALNLAPDTDVSTPYGFLMPNHSGKLWVYWDQILIGQNMAATNRGPALNSGPVLLLVPQPLLTPGTHQLEFLFSGAPSQLGFVLSPLVGPMAELRPLFQAEQLKLVYLPVALAAVSVAIALLFFATFRNDPSVKGLGWLTLGLSISAGSVLGIYYAPPLDWANLFDRLRPMSFHLSFLCFLFAFSRFRQHYNRAVLATITTIYAGFAIAILIVSPVNVYQVAVYWIPLTYLLGLVMLYQLCKYSFAPQPKIVPLIPIAILILFTVHDIQGVSQGGQFWAGQLLSIYNPSLLALALMCLLVSRANLHLTEMLILNNELEQRVADKHTELQENYHKIAETDRREAVIDERERLVREMHDGLGSQLVSTLAMVESGKFSADEVEAALRDSLDDLRIMVHSLDQSEARLVDLLALIRERIEPRMARQGIRFKWRVEDPPEDQKLDAEMAGHVLRIVQEALTNVIKHADAKTISLSTGHSGGETFLVIEDDGVGFTPKPSQATAGLQGGRGLTNMQHRAAQLGGRLAIESLPDQQPGVRITLWLPHQITPASP